MRTGRGRASEPSEELCPCSAQTSSNVMPAISSCARSAGRGRPRSSARAFWWSARAGSGRRCCSIWRRRAWARSGSSTTTRSRYRTCSARSSTARPRSVRRRSRARPPRSVASIRMSRSRCIQRASPWRMRSTSSVATMSSPMAPTISRRVIWSRMPASSRRSRSSRRRSVFSTARSPPSAPMSEVPTASRTRPTAACFRSRRRPAPFPLARRRAFSARSPACSAR